MAAMTIEVILAGQGFFAGMSEVEGLDEARSAEAYGGLLDEAIRGRFPAAAVTVRTDLYRQHPSAATMVSTEAADAAVDLTISETIDDLRQDVWNRGGFCVDAAGTVVA